MKKENNKNIINFSHKINPEKKEKHNIEIKNFEGFDYVKTDVDLNGNPFIKENLLEYSYSCKYLVRVMIEKNQKVFLYNYYVPQENLSDFLSKIENGEYDGKIIDIEKYIPEDLA